MVVKGEVIMRILKIVSLILYCLALFMLIGLILDNTVLRLIGYISSFIASILSIVRMTIEKNNNQKKQ